MNTRLLPHVCANEKCKELILPPYKTETIEYDYEAKKFIRLCNKCKTNGGI